MYEPQSFTELAIYYRGGKVKVVGKPKPSSSAQERFAQQVSIGYSLAWLWLLLKSAALKIFWISAKTEFADCEASTLKYICCTLPVSYPLRLQIRRGLWTVMLPSTWSDFGLFKVTCGVAPSFDSIPQGGRWDCGTAPTASPTLPRCRRFVCNKVYFVIHSYKVTWLVALQWYHQHLELVGDGTLRGMTGHWRKYYSIKCQQKYLARWNHLPQILLTRRLSSMANSTTESKGSFLLSSITSSFSACPIVLQIHCYFHRWLFLFPPRKPVQKESMFAFRFVQIIRNHAQH